MHTPSGCGIWEKLKLNCDAHHCSVGHAGSCVQLLLCFAFDFVAVAVAQFGLPISEQVAKIHRRLPFAVVICVLFIAVAAML